MSEQQAQLDRIERMVRSILEAQVRPQWGKVDTDGNVVIPFLAVKGSPKAADNLDTMKSYPQSGENPHESASGGR